MKVAIITSNNFHLGDDTRKGTEIFFLLLVRGLAKISLQNRLALTAFCSGDSDLPVKIESIQHYPTTHDITIPPEKNIIFELALLSKAFSMQNEFDLYHINIGDGDLALPFYPFVKKPILITIHHILDAEYVRRYFFLYKQSPNIFFISASNAQRKLLPDLNYLTTIYHGIDTKVFQFNSTGGENIMWAGRAIPEKGINIVVEVADRVKRKAKLFGIQRKEHQVWLQKTVLDKIQNTSRSLSTSLEMGLQRLQ